MPKKEGESSDSPVFSQKALWRTAPGENLVKKGTSEFITGVKKFRTWVVAAIKALSKLRPWCQQPR